MNNSDKIPGTSQEKRELLAKLLREREQLRSPQSSSTFSSSPITQETAEKIPPGYYRFEESPEWLNFQYQRQAFFAAGVPNPLFRKHEGAATAITAIDGREYINYSNYNYLGFGGDLRVNHAAVQAIEQYGSTVSASRLVAGEIGLHTTLERALAELIGTEDCLAFTTGYSTAVSVIGHLFKPSDLILHDSLIHSCALAGAQLSGAQRIAFPHNNPEAADRILQEQRKRYRRVLIVIEGVYSMDGDNPDLPRFLEIKNRHQAMLMVDEAHSIGVLGKTGRGIAEHFGISPNDVEIWMGTLSKAFASCGGYIAAKRPLVEYLRYTTPGFLYSVGMTPANAAAALEAVRLLVREPDRVTQLHARATLFRHLLKNENIDVEVNSSSPVIPAIVGDTTRCLRISQEMFERGINVQGIYYPAVENNASRLRFFLTCLHTEEQIYRTVSTLKQVLDLYTL